MKEKFHRYVFNAAFKVEDSNNFEIKEILNYANCGQLFEGGGFQRCSEVFFQKEISGGKGKEGGVGTCSDYLFRVMLENGK